MACLQHPHTSTTVRTTASMELRAIAFYAHNLIPFAPSLHKFLLTPAVQSHGDKCAAEQRMSDQGVAAIAEALAEGALPALQSLCLAGGWGKGVTRRLICLICLICLIYLGKLGMPIPFYKSFGHVSDSAPPSCTLSLILSRM